MNVLILVECQFLQACNETIEVVKSLSATELLHVYMGEKIHKQNWGLQLHT